MATIIRPQDIALWAGGSALRRFGTLAWTPAGHDVLVETFARAGAAYRRTRSGVLIQSGTDVPRVEFDADEGEAWRLELSRTNLLLRSEEFNDIAWPTQFCTVTADQATAPDGAATADKVVLDGTADPFISQVVETGAPLENRTFTWSVWAWTDAGQPTEANLFLMDSPFTVADNVPIVLTTEPQRFVFTFTFPLGTTATAVRARIDGAQVPSAGDYFYAWGAMLEEAAFATSYIKTTTGTATRPAETASLPLPPSLAAWPVQGGWTRYTRFVAGMDGDGGLSRPMICEIGVGSVPFWGLYHLSSTRVRSEFGAAGGFSGSNPTSPISAGQLVETLDFLYDDGGSQCIVSVDGGPAVDGGRSAPVPEIATAPAPTTLAINISVDGSTPGAMDLLSLLVLPTALTGTAEEMLAAIRAIPGVG